MKAESLLDAIGSHMREHRPAQISATYVDGWLTRHRPQLLQVLAEALPQIEQRRAMRTQGSQGEVAAPELVEADLWTPAKRTKANLAAMEVAAKRKASAGSVSEAERRVLARYSGWGGLSLEGLDKKAPKGLPLPEARGLIHEYYTPTAVVRAVAAMVAPLVDELRDPDGTLRALEPSCGIGRFLGATTSWPNTHWDAVEYSPLSATMARLLYGATGAVHVHEEPFERFVSRELDRARGTYGLVLANPPYGPRGASMTEDADRAFRDKKAYVYFLRRALSFLKKDGLGVFLVPAGFMTSRSKAAKALRTELLREHHLAAAFRLPSKLFPGAMLVTDLVVFRARGGQLEAVSEEDAAIVDGGYFKGHPDHILGEEVGNDSEEDDQTRPARWRYEVRGTFTGLPPLQERPTCGACALTHLAEPTYKAAARNRTADLGVSAGILRSAVHTAAHSTTGAEERWHRRRTTGLDDKALKAALAKEFGTVGMTDLPGGAVVSYRGAPYPRLEVHDTVIKGRALIAAARLALDLPPPVRTESTRGVARAVVAANRDEGAPLPQALLDAQALGLRVDRYMADVAAENRRAGPLWAPLRRDLARWREEHGNPHADIDLVQLAKTNTSVARLLGAFTRAGILVAALRTAPAFAVPRKPADIEGIARDLYAAGVRLTSNKLLTEHQRLGGKKKAGALLKTLLDRHGWADDDGTLVPPEDYLSGELWPKLDRAQALADKGELRAKRNVERLTEAVAPVPFEEIPELTPRDGWLPIGVIGRWLDDLRKRRRSFGHRPLTLVRESGLVGVKGVAYEDL